MSIAASPIFDLGAGAPPTSLSSGNWLVLRVRSRQEKIVAQLLAQAGIPCYLPLVAMIRPYAGRLVAVRVPLFCGYVFFRGGRDDIDAAGLTRRITEVREIEDQLTIRWALANVQLALQCGCALQPTPAEPRSIRVQVTGGPFSGLEGYQSKAPGLLILQVPSIEPACLVETGEQFLRPIC